MRYLITGGCGFLGSNLASEVFKKGHELVVFDNLCRLGSSSNLQWLKSHGEFKFHHADIRNYNDVERCMREARPDVVFHLAGQVAMTTSIDDPRLDFEVNVLGSHNLLEVARRYFPETIILYSSTNKVYGNLENFDYHETATRYVVKGFENGFDEFVGLDFCSPYGCSKGAADQYMLDYARVYGLRTVVFRHSSIFGGRQFSTYDQGWIGWFVQKALEIKSGRMKEPFTISGDGKQVRDVLFVSDLVRLYFDAVSQIEAARGQAFNIGGGVDNSLSLLELFHFLEEELGIDMIYRKLSWRHNDQKVYIADIRKAEQRLQWRPLVHKADGLRRMIAWVKENA
ncbi:NAD-dependent epimerase/dehydratase family protein [bacterium]|nr:MAG: NAD-dependent epimerase/dehydratase family protein [bacterium]